MELPPSGWYPDPYGTPRLLRWWDGSSWTHHTHPDVSAPSDGTGNGQAAGGEPATAVQATTVQPATVQSNTARPTTVQQSGVPATTVQPAVSRLGMQATSGQATTVQPGADWLRPAKPPTGPPTQPQPALPADARPASSGSGGGANGADGTQVLFLGDDAWRTPDGPTATANPYGYQQAQQRRRRLWLIAGLSAGTAVAVAVIAVIATSLGGSPSTTAADKAPTPKPSSASPTPSAAPSPSPSASASSSASGAPFFDSQSGLTYTQLPPPWQGPACPSTLDTGGFTWTAGEYDVAGPVNNGANTWYGEACSGPLPLQYGYNGVADLQNVTNSLAQNFGNEFYSALAHSPIAIQANQPVTISGHPGWEITYQVSYTNAPAQQATWTSEDAAVVLMDTGTGNEPAVFFTSVPDTLGVTNVTTLVNSLQVTAPVATASPTAPVSDTPSDEGSGGPNP